MLNVFGAQNRIIAIGDLHGDYGALRYCLEYAAGVIDSAGKWVGGGTYVVVCGDIIHRNRPDWTVTDADGWGIGEIPDEELLILDELCRLDTEARLVGGRVLKVIGNHELMELVAADMRYVTRHAKEDVRRREKLLAALRRCGVHGVVQIGDWIFMHGGLVEAAFSSSGNFYEQIDAQTADALANKTLSKQLESVTWDRTWSGVEQDKVDCTRLGLILDRLVPNLRSLGYEIDPTRLRMAVGHSVQMFRKSGLVPSRRSSTKDAIVLSGKLKSQRGGAIGINSDCNGRIWRLDVGMSRAFDGKQLSTKSKKDAILEMWARRPQVLEIIGTETRVRISKRALPRPASVINVQYLR